MADSKLQQVALWRATHPEIEIREEPLLTMAPFASLYASDFLVYAERKGLDKEALDFFKALHRECVWAYGNWQKAQRDSNSGRLFADILNAARPVGGEDGPLYSAICRFLKDYAEANNIPLDNREVASWEATFTGEVTAPPVVENGADDALKAG